MTANGAAQDADLRRLDRHALQEPEEPRLDDGRRHGHRRSFNAAQTAVEMGCSTGSRASPASSRRSSAPSGTRDSIGTDQPTFGSSMTLNGVYSWTGRREQLRPPRLRAHARRARVPARGAVRRGGPRRQRRQPARHAAGAPLPVVGLAVDHRRVHLRQWLRLAVHAPAWHAHLDTQGSRDIARLNAFIQSIPWYNLVPSGLGGMRTLVSRAPASMRHDYVAAAATPTARCSSRTFHRRTRGRSRSTWPR